jgi:hypothetical protein
VLLPPCPPFELLEVTPPLLEPPTSIVERLAPDELPPLEDPLEELPLAWPQAHAPSVPSCPQT